MTLGTQYQNSVGQAKADIYTKVAQLAAEDARVLKERDQSYGSSWKKRGGVGAFMMMARKWDRIENQTEKMKFDIFELIRLDPSPTGILDDIRDLRRYLLLVEAEMAIRMSAVSGISPMTQGVLNATANVHSSKRLDSSDGATGFVGSGGYSDRL